MIYTKEFEPKIIHQGVDTLLTSHVIMNSDSYMKYLKVLRFLDSVKDEAKEKNRTFEFESGISFEFYSFGKFKMMPVGKGRFKYIIMNDDITIDFSTLKLGANEYTTPQLRVEYRSKYLSLLGHEKAYATVLSMFDTLLSSDTVPLFKSMLMRIDLCTDIAGISYVPMDKYRFQTNFKSNGHIEFREHMRFNRLTGFSFGKGDYMMRIYDKRLELNNNASKLWLTRLWVANGYPDNNSVPVWRHETQMRRPYLKRFRKDSLDDEVTYFFNMLPNLWTFSFNKVEYVEVSDDHAIKILNGSYNPESLRKMMQRTKKSNPSMIWGLASSWHGLKVPSPHDYGHYQSGSYAVAKRMFKSFISTAYKAGRGNPNEVLEIMDMVQNDLSRIHGVSLHDYGSVKLLSTFIDNSQYISDNGFTIDTDYRNLAVKMYNGLRYRLSGLDYPEYDRAESRLASSLNMTVEEIRSVDLNELFASAFEIDRDEIQPIYEMEYICD